MTTVIICLITLLALANMTGLVSSGQIWLLSFFFLGMPHGAFDAIQLWETARHRLLHYIGLAFFYFAIGILMLAFWRLSIVATGIFFLGLTVWHWGLTEAQRAGGNRLTGIARSGWVVTLPIGLDIETTQRVLLALTERLSAEPVSIQGAGSVFFILGVGFLIIDVLLRVRQQAVWDFVPELLVLLLAVSLLDASAFIAIYFICVHALVWMTQNITSDLRALVMANWQGLAISSVFLIPWVILLPVDVALWQADTAATAAYLLLISALTLPHCLLELSPVLQAKTAPPRIVAEISI